MIGSKIDNSTKPSNSRPLIALKKPPIRKTLTEESLDSENDSIERANPAERRGRKATGLTEQSHDSGAAKLTSSPYMPLGMCAGMPGIARSLLKGHALKLLATYHFLSDDYRLSHGSPAPCRLQLLEALNHQFSFLY